MAERKPLLYRAILIGAILAGCFAFLCPVLIIVSMAFGPESFAGDFLGGLSIFFGYMLGLMFLYFLVIVCIILLQKRDFAEEMAITQGKIETMVERQNENMGNLLSISWLSDQAKALVHHEHEVEALHETFHSLLIKQDYHTARKLIEQMESRLGMIEEAAEMREEIENSKRTTIDEQIDKAIARIRGLLDRFEWARAKREADRLIKHFPENDNVAMLPSDIETAYNNRKGVLLREYDRAVKVNDIEKGIELLKELDKYLTPQEAAALTESARDVFKKKLHNLGVQFSIAIADGEWATAVSTGTQISQEFPNSRMAREVREKMGLLKQYAETVARGGQPQGKI